MDGQRLGSGDSGTVQTKPLKDLYPISIEEESCSPKLEIQDDSGADIEELDVTLEMIDDNEIKVKERIAQCRKIIESLKIELDEEKAKVELQNEIAPRSPSPDQQTISNASSSTIASFENFNTGMYSECVDNKLNYDENILKYEKQLQKYQNTLSMAQIEKKNAIRKQMLSKAYRLKLLEVENQCNIELLRVKQSLQCLEPLQMIASKWQITKDDSFDAKNLELMPRYPEISEHSNYDSDDFQKELENDVGVSIYNVSVIKEECITPD